MRAKRIATHLLAVLGLLSIAPAGAGPPVYPPVTAGRELAFPRDFGAHPEFRTEWWYVTGWLEDAARRPIGFQITFFRVRPEVEQDNPSRFAPQQLLFVHAALSDPAVGHLAVEQRAARAGFGLAEARENDTDVHIDDWMLKRNADGRYAARISGSAFALEMTLTPSLPPMLQGERGFSRKGPLEAQASYYYSEPQLAVRATVTRAGRKQAMTGSAWLDHEWSTAFLTQEAVGWDWTGINLDDGGALMAFRVRDAAGATIWASANLRRKDGTVVHYPPEAVRFTTLRRWRSGHTGGDYPVAQQLQIGDITFDLDPLQDDQELDSRATIGAVYWEGAVTALQSGKRIGRGYLELTGYVRPLNM